MYNPPALPAIPALGLDLYLSPPLPPSSPPRMAPYIIELSSDSEPLPPPPPSKKRRHTTFTPSKTSTSHPSSPRPPKSQKSITSFFSPPGIKGEQLSLPALFASQQAKYFDPIQPSILFEESDLMVDAEEAVMPEPFDAPLSPPPPRNPKDDDDEWERFTPTPEETGPKQKSPKSARKKKKPPAPAVAAAAEKRKFQAVQTSPERAAGDVKKRLVFAAVPSVYGNGSSSSAAATKSSTTWATDLLVSRFRAVKTGPKVPDQSVVAPANAVCTSPPPVNAPVMISDPMDIDTCTHNTPPPPVAPTLARSKYVNDIPQSTPIARQTFGMPYSERAAYVASLTGRAPSTPLPDHTEFSQGFMVVQAPSQAPTPASQLPAFQLPAFQLPASQGFTAVRTPTPPPPISQGFTAVQAPSQAPALASQLPAFQPPAFQSPAFQSPAFQPPAFHLPTSQGFTAERAPTPQPPVSQDISIPQEASPIPATSQAVVHSFHSSPVPQPLSQDEDLPQEASPIPATSQAVVVHSIPQLLSQDEDLPQIPTPTPEEEDDFPLEDPFKGLKGPIKVNDLREIICTLHSDPKCDLEECAHEFFENYCPMGDTNIGDLVYPDYVHVKRRNQTTTEEEVLYPPLRRKEMLAVLIAGGYLGESRRLPYLDLEMREFLRNNKASMMAELKTYDGDLLHVQFTIREILRLGPAVREYAQKNNLRVPTFTPRPSPRQMVQDLFSLLTYTFSNHNDTKKVINIFLQATGFSLPGRQQGDIKRFIWDAYNKVPDLDDPILMVELSKLPPIRGSSMQSLRRELGVRDFDPTLSMMTRINYVMANMRPVWTFNGGSSDIHDVAWTPSGERFAMSTPCTSDEYNRPGNLMLGYTNPPSVRMLYRHALRVRPTAVGNFEKYEYVSVPSIRFSNDGNFLHSCGLDGFVKTWGAKDGKWLGEVSFPDQVVVMETSPVVNGLLAAGRSKGVVSIVRIDEHGVHDPRSVSNLNIVEKSNKNKIYPAAMAWGGVGFGNILVAGYDNEGNNKTGGLAIWDIEKKMNIFKLHGHVKHPQRHFDVYMGERGRFVTGSLRTGRPEGSVVRLWDLNSMSGFVECFSDQADLNRVTISPCERYLTSSGTTNNTLVWDIRHTTNVLHNLQHGATTMPTSDKTNLAEDDTGVTFIKWHPFNSTVFTGGSDGKVKQWDVTRADPFMLDVASVESQIMIAAFNPCWDTLIVGEASGRATLFSAAADEGDPVPEIVTDWNEDRSMMNPNGDDDMRWSTWNGQRSGARAPAAAAAGPAEEEEQSESGVLISREMINDGLICRDPLNPRYVWATSKYKRQKQEEKRRGGRS